MATVNKCRTDERVPVNSEPFMFSSAIIDATDLNQTTVLKKFTALDGTYLILDSFVEVIEAFDASADLAISLGSVPTTAVISSTVVTAVTAGYFAVTANVTEATPGLYPAAAASQVFVNKAAGTASVVKGADTTVPVIYSSLTTGATVGKARVHVLMVKIPVA